MWTQRFWPKTKPQSGCIVWTGATTKGYGNIKAGDKVRLSHRVLWEAALGPIPAGKILLHTCDTPACVALQHLDLGTHAQNIQDRDTKGRTARGERQGNAKLTDAAAAEIRTRYAAGDVTQVQLAREYGVSQTTISDIVIKRSRKP